MSEYYSAVIVGAGPTGLALANLLGLYGLDALLIERSTGTGLEPRAITLDDEGQRICQAMGLLDEVQAQLTPNIEAYYLSGTRLLARVAPTTRRNGFPLISAQHQPTFESTLLAGLKRFPCITVQFEQCLEAFEQRAGGVRVSLRDAHGNSREVECAYLLGCDGAKSTVRNALKLPLRGATYAQQWLVVDTVDDPDPATAARFFCNPARPSVSVPSPERRRRWEFLLLPGESTESMLLPETIRTLIQQANGPRDPLVTRSAVYTFHAATASTYQRERVFLLGDAAHLMPPFGGQGMNCGLRDAHNLAWKLSQVLRGQLRPALLNSYTRERLPHTRRLIAFSRLLGAVLLPTARPVAWGRDALFGLINAFPASRNYLRQAGVKPQPRYRHGFLLHDGDSFNRSLAGLMLPQPRISSLDAPSRLLDNLLGTSFTLLRLNNAEIDPFADIANLPLWRRLGTTFLSVGAEVRAALNTRQDLYILVRPDRYIYGACAFDQVAHFARLCEQSLLSGDSVADAPQ